MQLLPPLLISSRLMAGVRIPCNHDHSLPDAWVQVERTKDIDRRGASYWRVTIDLPDGSEHTEKGLAGWGDTPEMLACALDFLAAAIEDRDPGAERMWPEHVTEWATQHSDEITMLEIEIREGLES